MSSSWYALPLNAEPWKSPSVGVGRRSGKLHAEIFKDQGLSVFQNAVREEMAAKYPDAAMVEGEVDIRFYFWRNLEVYKGARKQVQRHACDATNAQKALEDALQGILYANDASNVHVASWMMEQGTDVEPMILIRVEPNVGRPDLSAKLDELVAAWPELRITDNERDVAGVF